MKRLWLAVVFSLACALPVAGGDATSDGTITSPRPLTTVHFDDQIFGNDVTFSDFANPGFTEVAFKVPAFFEDDTIFTAPLTLFTDLSQQGHMGVASFDKNCSFDGCALEAISFSDRPQTSAVFGSTRSQTARNYGVRGISVGTASSLLSPENSAGVKGEAGDPENSTGAPSGVMGIVSGSGNKASGVFGTASNSAANGGAFQNTGSAGLITAFLATSINGTNYALFSSNGGVKAASLTITGAKSFIAPDPEDPSKEIQYVSVEAPTSDVYFRGSARLENGEAVIAVPDHFRLTARPGSYMATVTPVGSPAALYVESQDAKGIVVRGAGHAAFNYVVYAERDLARNNRALRPNVDFTPEAIEKGGGPAQLAPRLRELLVRNGTLNPDGTYRQDTADKMGWKLPETDDTNR